MTTTYTNGLQLWIRDTGDFDGFAVYVNGELRMEVSDQDTKKYDVDAPHGPQTIVIHFLAESDGGTSALVHVTDGGNKLIEKQTGTRHSYIILPRQAPAATSVKTVQPKKKKKP